jgi:hypothetical protein
MARSLLNLAPFAAAAITGVLLLVLLVAGAKDGVLDNYYLLKVSLIFAGQPRLWILTGDKGRDSGPQGPAQAVKVSGPQGHFSRLGIGSRRPGRHVCRPESRAVLHDPCLHLLRAQRFGDDVHDAPRGLKV